ncbi:MAG: SpoIIE family protein phosphatase [candidate division KSB1 bacterium]|nr:SpoIIE family protein phosphatase [candidate division KSB1 bacterium]MDZ7273824.1 SpoIIE family protein phosphatase [candidate division KSB1 bacterium]MDZ7285980.1 SpoIIE family protein phosphatase [candidate division KSB1 bacterium]MDZ7299012.1 SpoIIE family protein phosphatase [candidate division KSB1 bacterium]MDZ7307981.1 SpoIIE family protein phosphatase [candidate division KSB1 bacterium]
MRRILKNTIFSVPFLTFLGVTLVDSVWFMIARIPEIVRLFRDGMLLAAIILLLPLRERIKILSERRIFHTLRYTFLTALAALVVLTIIDQYLMAAPDSRSPASRLFLSPRHFLIGTAAAFLLLFLHLLLSGLLANLIFYKSKGSTLRNFRLLVFAILLMAATASARGRVNFFASFEQNWLGDVPVILLLLLIGVNALRHRWIDYLNRRQKWLVFLASALACGLGVMLTQRVAGSFVADHSIAFAAVCAAIALFFSVYAGVTAFALMLHLPTAGSFDEKINAIKTLQELSQSISHFMEREQLMAMITQRALQVTRSDFAWLELLEEAGAPPVLCSAVNLSEREQQEMPLSRETGISGWVIQNQKSLLINDVTADARAAGVRPWKKDIGAILAVPLISRGQILGVLFSAKQDYFGYDQFDQDMLQSFADQAAIAFHNAHLLAESLEKERLSQELRVAHEAQVKLLPKIMPAVPGLEVAGVSVAAQEVGGDYFDVFTRGRKLVVVVGDVSGKGAAAAFYMAQVKGVVEALGRHYDSPREVLLHTNRILRRSLEKNLFITLLYAVFDPDHMTMTFSRAGHNPLLQAPRSRAPAFLQPAGMAIGLEDGPAFEAALQEMTLPVAAGDFFVFYTDGVVEARNDNEEEYQEKSLLAVVQQRDYQNAEALKERILLSIYDHVGLANTHDDFTVVVVGVTEQPRGPARMLNTEPEAESAGVQI